MPHPKGITLCIAPEEFIFFDFSPKKSDKKLWHFEKQNAHWSESLVFQKKPHHLQRTDLA